jgi:hypothetical protein
MECLSFCPSYIGEGEDFGPKHMGLEQGASGNTLGEQSENLGNVSGTWWEFEGNKEKIKKIKKIKSSPHPKLKGKKIEAPWVHASAYPLAACIFGTPFTKHTVPLGNMLIMPLGTWGEHTENMVGNTKIQKNQNSTKGEGPLAGGISWPQIYINRSRPSAWRYWISCGYSKPPACNLLSIKYPKLGVIGAQFWKKNWALNL